MSATGWRNVAAVLALLCLVMAWRNCHRPRAAAPADACADDERTRRADCSGRGDFGDDGSGSRSGRARSGGGSDDLAAEDDEENSPAWSVTAPAWVLWLAPQPGEDLLDYRDRIVPLAQAAVAPHRSRVDRGRDDFAAAAGLNSSQRAELDAAVEEAATAIQDRVMNAAFGGELLPSTFKPTTGVAVARDVLDAVDKANRRFQGTLRDDQRAALSKHPFDVADYLLFSTRWEDMIGAK